MKNYNICGELRKMANFAAAKNHDDRFKIKLFTNILTRLHIYIV